MKKRALLGSCVLALAVGLLAASACQPGAMLLASSASASVDEILAAPERFVGRRVVTGALVERVVGEEVIALRSTDGAQMLAIVHGQALAAVDAIVPGEALQVAGTVRAMSRDELRQVEQQFGIQFNEERLLEVAGQAPFLVAQRVSK